jgi:hypothetical protein
MRFGGAVANTAFAGLIFALAGCGSQSSTPKTAEGLPTPSASTLPGGGNAGAAGASQHLAGADGMADYPDPSKLLESYEVGNDAAPGKNGKPSNSGLRMEVRERGPGQPWLVHIVNHGDQPAELVADTRLLWFEVKLSGKKKQSLCKLPEPLSGAGQPESRLIVHLEPGEGVADQFDPRLYCFAEGDQKLLVPGAEVTPHFGWPDAPPKKRWKRGKLVEEPVLQKPPFVARQSLETEHAANQPAPPVSPKAAARLTSAGVTGADKQLEGATLALQSEYAVWTRKSEPPASVPSEAPTGEPSEPPPPQPALGLRLVQGSDAKAEHDATIQLTLLNQSPLPSYVYFRREMVSFEVAGPAGITQCPGRLDDRTPERSSFLHLTRNAKRSYSCRLAELCPRGTFASPGLYLVYARFDATLSGRDQGIDAFVGPVYSRTPATVRIRTGEEAIFQKRPMMRTTEGQPHGAAGSGTP